MTQVLQVKAGDRSFEVEAGSVAVIGRHPDSALVVEDDRVSRRHVQVRHLDGEWILEDLGSANGTFVDGMRVSRRIVDGAVEVRLGGLDGAVLHLDPRSLRPSSSGDLTAPGGLRHRETMVRPWSEEERAVAPQPDGEELGAPLRLHPVRAGTIRIGRADDNDVVIHDLEASRHHAAIEIAPGRRPVVRDLDSHNGTYVSGQRITAPVELADGQIVSIGSRLLRLGPGGLEEHSANDHLPLAAIGVRVVTDDGAVLLDDVTFSLEESSMMAVLGPSGAGKSTLLGALTGLRPASGGRVLCGGQDLYSSFDALSRRIGYVPQDDLVQPELTVEQSISYAARLRFPPDVSAAEREQRVSEVMDELGLSHRASVRVGSLSGGQRKRVSIALELLTKPSLIFLDEPTSGLDPGYERSVMLALRRLADTGRTVVLVTHSVESLHLCDRILCLAPGGKTAWFGPPEETAEYFGMATYQEIFQVLDTRGARDHAAAGGTEAVLDPDVWKERYERSEAHERYVHRPLAAFDGAERTQASVAVAARSSGGWLRQYTTLTSRYARIVMADRRTLTIIAVTAPILGLILLLRLPPGQLASPSGADVLLFSQAPLVLFVVAIGITQVATSTSIREIVKEREILRRERTVGLSASAYVLSKLTILGGLAVVQAVVIVGIATLRQEGPDAGLVLGSGRLELMVVGALVAIGAMALGLFVSAVVASPDRVALVLPAVLGFHLIVTSGEVMPSAPKVPVIQQARYLSTARWGYTAMAASADVERLAVANRAYGEVPDLTTEQVSSIHTIADIEALAPAAPEIAHTKRAWFTSVGALVGLTAAFVLATVVAIRRAKPK